MLGGIELPWWGFRSGQGFLALRMSHVGGTKLAWLTLGLSLLAAGAYFYCRHFSDDAGVALYVEAARCLLKGEPLQTCNPFYTYPPIVALLSIPLIPLPLVLQNLVWYAMTIAAMLYGLILEVRLSERLFIGQWSDRDRVILCGVGILMSAKFVFAAIASQNYDVIVVLLVLIGLVRVTEDHSRSPVLAGIALGCAAALKATPLLFLLYLPIKGHYRTAAAMAVTLVVASLLPDIGFGGGYLSAWIHQVASPALTERMQDSAHAFWWATNTNNNSLRGLVGMFVADGTPSFKPALYAVYSAYVAIVAILIGKSSYSRSAITIDGALLLVSMLMLSPMSSESHYVAMTLAIFAVTAIWVKGDAEQRKLAGYFLIFSFLMINVAARDVIGVAITTWAKDCRLLTLDALLFLAPFAILLFQAPRAELQLAPAE